MVTVIIPTYNAATYLPALLKSLRDQTMPHQLIVIDSDSTDNTREIVSREKALLIVINKGEFNHGATRNLGLESAESEVVIFMTQDALPASIHTLEYLVNALCAQDNIAIAYGRQLPYPQTKIFGRFARLINYPAQSIVKTKALIPKLGIKTCSCSNSFAAYRKTDLRSVGAFPSNTILGEDVSVAARLILQGKGVAYSAEAQVFHSHDYTLVEEFKRYFDIGVFHHEQRVVLRDFSKAESEGFKYVIQELQYLSQNGYVSLIPNQIMRTVAKFIGYQLGSLQQYIPVSLKRRLSMHSSFWR